MGKRLAEIESRSNPGEFHIITEGKDGVIYCDCWAWKRNRTCKHLDEYHARSNVKKFFEVPEIMVDEDPIFTENNETAKAVEQAIKELRG